MLVFFSERHRSFNAPVFKAPFNMRTELLFAATLYIAGGDEKLIRKVINPFVDRRVLNAVKTDVRWRCSDLTHVVQE